MRQIHILALALLAGVSVARAEEAATPWASAGKTRAAARLVAASPGLAGLEIRLAPGAITYWRNPGEAGLPPSFDFAASSNLAAAEPILPAPTRIAESDGGEAFGYREALIAPIRVTPRDPAKPVKLALALSYAVCETICVPADAKLTLDLPPPGAAPTAFAAPLAAALAAAPRAVPLQEFGALSPLDAKSWRLCAPPAGGPPRDLFVEPPEGWYFSTKADGEACFRIALEQTASGAALPVAVRLTMSGGAQALETDATLATPR